MISELASISGYLALPIVILSLIISWKDINSRWLLTLVLVFEIVDEGMYLTAYSWGAYYYLWGVALNILLIFFILFRRPIASAFYSGLPSFFWVFKDIVNHNKFLYQEGAIAAFCVLSALLHSLTFVEFILFQSGFIFIAPLSNYIYPIVQHILHYVYFIVVMGIAATSFKQSNSNKIKV